MSETSLPLKKYFVRFSNENDVDRVKAFYRANPHKDVCARNNDLIEERICSGAVSLIETETGEVVAASISYPLTGEDGAPGHKWLEIGTTRIALNGYPGLFDVMIAMQIMRAYLVEPPEERFVCQMESAAVRKKAWDMGFRPYTPSEELVRVSDKTVGAEESSGADNWYSAGPEALPVVAQRLMSSADKGILQHYKDGSVIGIDFSRSRFFSMFREELSETARRDLGSPDQPDYGRGVAASCRAWMKSFFK